MNEIKNKYLLSVDKFMPEMHLKQTGFTYSAYGLLVEDTKIQKLKKQKIRDIFI